MLLLIIGLKSGNILNKGMKSKQPTRIVKAEHDFHINHSANNFGFWKLITEFTENTIVWTFELIEPVIFYRLTIYICFLYHFFYSCNLLSQKSKFYLCHIHLCNNAFHKPHIGLRSVHSNKLNIFGIWMFIEYDRQHYITVPLSNKEQSWYFQVGVLVRCVEWFKCKRDTIHLPYPSAVRKWRGKYSVDSLAKVNLAICLC